MRQITQDAVNQIAKIIAEAAELPLADAAYALWRLSWIHPFAEGNGRTARAVCLLIICLKHGVWLRGRTGAKTVRGSRKAYYDALLAADVKYEQNGTADVSALEAYLNKLLFMGASRQLLRGKKA